MDFGYKYNIKEIIMLSYLKKLFAIKSPAKEEPVANWPYTTATAPTAPTAVTTPTAEATVETVAKPKAAKKVATPKVPKVPKAPKLTVVKATTEEKPAKKPRAKNQ